MVVEINISIVEKNVRITERFFDNHYKGVITVTGSVQVSGVGCQVSSKRIRPTVLALLMK